MHFAHRIQLHVTHNPQNNIDYFSITSFTDRTWYWTFSVVSVMAERGF